MFNLIIEKNEKLDKKGIYLRTKIGIKVTTKIY